jgi:hypothetical protein
MTFETLATQAGVAIRQAVEVGEMSKTRTPEIERFERYRDQQARNQRVAAVIIGIAVPIALVLGIVGLLRSASDRKPAGAPQPTLVTPTPGDTFGGYVMAGTDVVARGRMTLDRYAALDIDSARHPENGGVGCDLAWSRVGPHRGMLTDPGGYTCGGSLPIFLGSSASWSSLTPERLVGLDYHPDAITGEGPSAIRTLHPGEIYAIFTNSGNYTKLEILTFGRTVGIRYVTYGITRSLPSPSPSA